MIAALIDSVRRRIAGRVPAALPPLNASEVQVAEMTERAIARRGRRVVSRRHVLNGARHYYEILDDRGDLYRIPRW